jgi:hypothetical protein
MEPLRLAAVLASGDELEVAIERLHAGVERGELERLVSVVAIEKSVRLLAHGLPSMSLK